MELKLEDYARRIDRFYYEIMREYAEGDPTTKDIEIFIRPSSGYLDVWRFVLQDDFSKPLHLGNGCNLINWQD